MESLANRTSRNKCTVFRSLQKLVSLDLCTKESKTLKAGGYYHVYNAVDIHTIQRNTEQKIRVFSIYYWLSIEVIILSIYSINEANRLYHILFCLTMLFNTVLCSSSHNFLGLSCHNIIAILIAPNFTT